MANNKKRKPRKVNNAKLANTVNAKTENANSTAERPAYGYSSSTSNRSMVLRVLILVVAGLMFLGAISLPFISALRG
ncbi:MAG: hypothetical protein IJL67_12790 [Oscillospiraceae bacterium]|nr:hypothetical protein [Oscillospiraceae bacterium]